MLSGIGVNSYCSNIGKDLAGILVFFERGCTVNQFCSINCTYKKVVCYTGFNPSSLFRITENVILGVMEYHHGVFCEVRQNHQEIECLAGIKMHCVDKAKVNARAYRIKKAKRKAAGVQRPFSLEFRIVIDKTAGIQRIITVPFFRIIYRIEARPFNLLYRI